MISLKRTIILATVAGTVLLGGTGTALACPGDGELPGGSVSATMPGEQDGGQGEQEGLAPPPLPLSDECAHVLVSALSERALPVNQLTGAINVACAQDTGPSGAALDYLQSKL